MKTVKFLMKQYGEFYYTPRDPYMPYVEGMEEYDKDKMAPTIRSNDDWRPQPKPMFAVEEIEIPEWMTPDEYIENRVYWKYYVKMFGNKKELAESFGRKAFYKINSISDGTLKYACVKLLKTKKFRSELRKSFKEQLLNWIENDSKYNSPFSYKQANLLCDSYTYTEAKRLGVAA